ncbi:MAG: hypothetical protein ACOYMN_15155 [Roseimicrobium sp.]
MNEKKFRLHPETGELEELPPPTPEEYAETFKKFSEAFSEDFTPILLLKHRQSNSASSANSPLPPSDVSRSTLTTGALMPKPSRGA